MKRKRRKTIQELILMYENGKGTLPKSLSTTSLGILHTDISTQREFIYNSVKTVDEYENEITKAGLLINSILEKNVQLPALYFWNVQDNDNNIHYAENEFNIHDGKQRFLSIYNFIRGIDPVISRLNGMEITYDGLSEDDKNKLLNYEFDIVIRCGTLKEEEQSFFLINTTGEPLTYYEGLRGAYHGRFFYEFENYINNLKLDKIKPVGRGEQTIWFLYLYLGIVDKNKKLLITSAKKQLELIRNCEFDRNTNNFHKKIELYNELCAVGMVSKNSEKNPQKICMIVNYVIDHNYNTYDIIYYYKKGFESLNDLDKWKFEVHKIALDNLAKGVKCDYRRFFNDGEKSQLYQKSNQCGMCGKKFRYDELRVDHIRPWSLGNPTDITNAQLLCGSCNSIKGGK